LNILIVDNFDSFTYNLYHYVLQFNCNVDVIKNTEVELSNLSQYHKIIISPGPGIPIEHKNIKSIIASNYKSKPILGICLGHQAIAQFFGADLINLEDVLHGVSSNIFIKENSYIFKDIPEKIKAGHYHSWAASSSNFPQCLEITSFNEDGIIMSIQHKDYDVIGLQFHPESIRTPQGKKLIKNWVNH